MNNIPSKQRVYAVLVSIPKGKVVTYGQLAGLAGLAKAARQMGQLLYRLPKDTDLPWHRVVNASGKISLPENSPGHSLQRARLEEEGIVFRNNKIRLKEFQWQP